MLLLGTDFPRPSANMAYAAASRSSRSSALVSRLVSRSTSGTLAFAYANANVSYAKTLAASFSGGSIDMILRHPWRKKQSEEYRYVE